jgi:hypothetical protein
VVSFTPLLLYRSTQWIGGWVDPRTDLEYLEKKKFFPHQDSNSDLSVIQPLASRYTDCAIQAPVSALVASEFTGQTNCSYSMHNININVSHFRLDICGSV